MKRMRSEKGAALIEAAMTVPMILLIAVGIFEFARAYQTQQVLVNASREGARIAVIDGTSDTDIRTRVNNYVKGGGLTALADGNIVIVRNALIGAGPATASSVELQYPFTFMVLNPVIRLITPTDTTTGAPITMKAVTLMRNE